MGFPARSVRTVLPCVPLKIARSHSAAALQVQPASLERTWARRSAAGTPRSCRQDGRRSGKPPDAELQASAARRGRSSGRRKRVRTIYSRWHPFAVGLAAEWASSVSTAGKGDPPTSSRRRVARQWAMGRKPEAGSAQLTRPSRETVLTRFFLSRRPTAALSRGRRRLAGKFRRLWKFRLRVLRPDRHLSQRDPPPGCPAR